MSFAFPIKLSSSESMNFLAFSNPVPDHTGGGEREPAWGPGCWLELDRNTFGQNAQKYGSYLVAFHKKCPSKADCWPSSPIPCLSD